MFSKTKVFENQNLNKKFDLMSTTTQIQSYLSSQPEPKRADMETF